MQCESQSKWVNAWQFKMQKLILHIMNVVIMPALRKSFGEVVLSLTKESQHQMAMGIMSLEITLTIIIPGGKAVFTWSMLGLTVIPKTKIDGARHPAYPYPLRPTPVTTDPCSVLPCYHKDITSICEYVIIQLRIREIVHKKSSNMKSTWLDMI